MADQLPRCTQNGKTEGGTQGSDTSASCGHHLEVT